MDVEAGVLMAAAAVVGVALGALSKTSGGVITISAACAMIGSFGLGYMVTGKASALLLTTSLGMTLGGSAFLAGEVEKLLKRMRSLQVDQDHNQQRGRKITRKR